MALKATSGSMGSSFLKHRQGNFKLDELLARDKVNLDISWLKDESLEDSENLPAPDILIREIADNLKSALEQFSAIYQDLEN